MTPNPYNEDQLLEQPAIALLAALGWQTLNALEETCGPAGNLGRSTKSEVVLSDRLRAALERFNTDLPAEAITAPSPPPSQLASVAMAVPVCSGRPRAAAKASRWCSTPRRSCAAFPATGPSR